MGFDDEEGGAPLRFQGIGFVWVKDYAMPAWIVIWVLGNSVVTVMRPWITKSAVAWVSEGDETLAPESK